MPTVLEWTAAFVEIHGRKPTKSDYSLAPSHVKNEYFAGCPSATSSSKGNATHKPKVRLKRPRLDSGENSPVKKRTSKIRKHCEDSGIQTRINPNKVLFSSTRTCVLSPVKLGKIADTQSKINGIGIGKLKSYSPVKLTKSPLKGLLTLPTFTSLFDTPEKGQSAAWGEISPQKSISTRTSTSSPRRPCSNKRLSVQNAKYLLLPTPEKRERKEVLEPFEPEEIAVSEKNVVETCSPEKGHVVRKVIKRRILNNATKSKKQEGNYVRINLKKKMFARGKVSAEQKRKMRRKQIWKKRM